MAGGGNKVLVEESGLTDFFADEDAKLRAATTAWLRANTPWDVVPADQVETVRVRALGGMNLKTGTACGGPRHSHEGYQRAFGSYDAADLRVRCGATCILRAIPNLRRVTSPTYEGGGELLADFETGRSPRARSDACYRPGGGQEMFLLSVRTGGHMDRCEGRPWEAAPSQACVCSALRKVLLPASAAGTRAAFDVRHQDPDGAITPPQLPPCTVD